MVNEKNVKIRAERLGNKIIKLLNLKLKDNGRVDTSGGDKTPLGLGFTIERAVQENAL